MREVGVAFPNDEPSALVIASRLRAEGIAARVDRGLWGSYQVGSRGQITVLVDERHAKRAHEVLGTHPRDIGVPATLIRLAIATIVVVIGIGVATIVALLSR